MLHSLALMVVSLVVLTLGAELLVSGSVALARRLRISSFFVGLTIVGFGTSTPELFTSLLATLRGQTGIAVGNVVGSNIFNIAFILGLTALIAPIPVRLAAVRSEIWVVIALALAPFLAVFSGGVLGRWLGALLLAALVVYLWVGAVRGRREGAKSAELEHELEAEVGLARAWVGTPVGSVLAVAGGLILLVGGSALLVDSATDLARASGVAELVIGLTLVASGTSAPELFTSLVAAARRQSDIAVGNVLGSNVFNIAGILGLSGVVHPQTLDPQVLRLDAPMMLAVSLALIPLVRGGRIGRVGGGILLAVYGVYLAVLLVWAPGRFQG